MTIEQKFPLMHRFHSREEYGGESPHEHPAPWREETEPPSDEMALDQAWSLLEGN